ncbi:MAG: hypothetical protein IKS68_00270, partial [Mailhella sp.]|nr:hypothetical protein [Mailhella sp.]
KRVKTLLRPMAARTITITFAKCMPVRIIKISSYKCGKLQKQSGQRQDKFAAGPIVCIIIGCVFSLPMQ